MIRFQCPCCKDEVYFLWPDVTKPGRCRCLKCGVVIIFMAATEEDLLRKTFKKREGK